MKQISLNQHMNLFHFFNESSEPKYIENNITRALAICISQDRVFQYAFLEKILSEDDFKSLFYTHHDGSNISVNLQVETSSIVDDTRRLYAIGLTDAVDTEDWSDLAKLEGAASGNNITDLVITINDIKVIIEIKRTGENCKEQLRRQITPFIVRGVDSPEEKAEIVPKHINWSSVLAMMDIVKNFYQFNNERSFYIDSFVKHIQQRYGHWIPTIPFKFLPFPESETDHLRRYQLDRRLMQSMHSIGSDKIQNLWDRTAITINRSWATEAIPEFMVGNDGKPYLMLMVWPGNTKQQGYSLYNRDLSWTRENKIELNGKSYEIQIDRHIKFMHFNKYMTSIDVPMAETDDYLVKEINTSENHYHNIAGKWHREQWPKLDEILNEHFKKDWKSLCKWDVQFEHSDRTYLTIALGYTVHMYIPYDQIQEMDNNETSYKQVGVFLESCKDAIVHMVENR